MKICGAFLKNLDGGNLVTIPSGILNGMLTNIGAALIMKIIPRIGFHSKHVQIHATMFSIFILSYINVAILPMMRIVKKGYIPDSLNAAWYDVYGKLI